MKVSDIMTRAVITIGPGDSIRDAVGRMLQNGIGGLPVVDENGHLAGMLTEANFLRRAETGTERRRSRWLQLLVSPGQIAEEYVHSHGCKVEEVMTTEPCTIASDATLDQVVRLMEKHQVKCIAVVDAGRVVGIVSRTNLLHAIAGVAREVPPAAKSDADIRERLLAELAGKSWTPSRLNVIVRNGEVELSGVIVDRRSRRAIRVAAENVPGVKAVRDHLVWVDPGDGLGMGSLEEEAAQDELDEAAS